MGQTRYIGKRIELVSMDPHFHDISIGLYMQEADGQPVFLLHTYSQKAGAEKRIAFLVSTMKTLGGLESTDAGLLYFTCGDAHEQAMKRIFLDSCKVSPASEVTSHGLQIYDKKAGCDIGATHTGNGVYQVAAVDPAQDCERRIVAIARGLLKLAKLEEVAECHDKVAFACGQAHDALIGLLLIRAPNVRAAMREAEMMASRGTLSTLGSQ